MVPWACQVMETSMLVDSQMQTDLGSVRASWPRVDSRCVGAARHCGDIRLVEHKRWLDATVQCDHGRSAPVGWSVEAPVAETRALLA